MLRSLSLGVLVACAVTGAAAACSGDGSVEPTTQPDVDAGPTRDADASAARPLCEDGKPTSSYPPEPHAPELLGTVPPLSFAGEAGPVDLARFYEPCAERSRVLVIRTGATWCGTCRWHAEHTRDVFGDPDDRVVVVDLIVADEDNSPATPASLAAWRALVAQPERFAAFGVDTRYSLRKMSSGTEPLPLYTFVDTRTMRAITVATNPDPELVRAKIAEELALLDGAPRPKNRPQPEIIDELTTYQRSLLAGMHLPGAPPPDPTNAHADAPAAASFGQQLFADATLSPSGTVSCATCHDQALGMADGKRQAEGVGGARGDRNTPSVTLAAHARWQFWDGRADTLWAQALGPFENDREMASSRLFVAHRIASAYAGAYAAAFPEHPLPDMTDTSRFPAAGRPGDAGWQAMTAADRDAVTRVFVDVGKAIAAFERTLRVQPNALDRYIGGDLGALSAAQKQGLHVFFRAGCPQCHWGPRLTDDAFHVIRFATGRVDGQADRGRHDAIAALLGSEFTAASRWSDDTSAARSFLGLDPPPPSMLGAFKTPSLRGITQTGPYGHGGMIPTLAEIARQYGQRGLPHDDARAIGGTEPWVPTFDTGAQADLAALLEVFAGDLAP